MYQKAPSIRIFIRHAKVETKYVSLKVHRMIRMTNIPCSYFINVKYNIGLTVPLKVPKGNVLHITPE